MRLAAHFRFVASIMTFRFVLFQYPTSFPDYVRGAYTFYYDIDSNTSCWK